MQRLFVMFPDRMPGLALLLLRCLAAAGVLGTLPGATPFAAGAALVVAVLLAIGWLTPFGALGASALLILSGGVPWPWPAMPACLLLLGPGAYSLDAQRFGRRVLHRGPGGRRGPHHPKE